MKNYYVWVVQSRYKGDKEWKSDGCFNTRKEAIWSVNLNKAGDKTSGMKWYYRVKKLVLE